MTALLILFFSFFLCFHLTVKNTYETESDVLIIVRVNMNIDYRTICYTRRLIFLIGKKYVGIFYSVYLSMTLQISLCLIYF